jgi:DNA-binding SARP family transcriptional activator/tetratricopeptide (TPR) repeat protein
MATGLEIRVFGGLRIVLNGAPLTAFISAKAPALLAYLAVTGRAQRRDDLAALLWGEMPDVDARNNLRQAVANLRRMLEPYLIITRETLELNPATPCFLDAAAFEQGLRPPAALAPDERVRQLQEVTALYTGDFLGGFFVRDAPAFEEWMLAQRARYRELALHALHTLTQLHLGAGQYDLVIDDATRLLALDAWREEAHCQLMLALARTGQRSAALAQYQRCRRLLRKELDVEPSTETSALYERIRAAMSAPRHNLPASTTGFVGRQAEIAELRRLLAAPNTRLLTILGPGGAGKTRLALEVAAACEPMFLNGVWFAPLLAAQPGGPDALAHAVADALGCPLSGPPDPRARLLAFLRSRELLLVLDNLEEWSDAADWLCELLAQAPGVKILAASRQRLNLQAERVFALDGLPVPPPGSPDAQAFASVQLFARRARRVQADFIAAEGEAAARICRAVQGLPLGIELAAAWAHQLTCAEIAGEIERSLDFLVTSRRDVSPRQRSLRAVFDWSWSRLTPDERAVFQHLAVFCGPFSRDAATQVGGAALPTLAALADKSLVWRRGTTYQLHEVARRFAWEKLDQAGEVQAIRASHAGYYARLLAQNEERLQGRDQKRALMEIEDQVEDTRAAWQWLVERRDVAGLAAATGGLYHFYLLRSRFRDGLEAFHTARLALQEVADAGRATQLAYNRAMAREARFCSSLAQYEPAQNLLAASLEALRELDAPAEVAFILGHMGGIARLQGDLDLAERRLQECLALRRQIEDRGGQAIALLELAGVAFMREDYETTRQRCAEGLAVGESSGDLQTMAHLLTGLSLSQRELGQYEQAQEFVRRSLVIYEELGDQYGVMQACLTLGELNRQLGDHAAAQRFCQRAVLVSQEIGDRSGEADGRYRLGQIAASSGEWDKALRQLRLALGQAHEIQETLTVLDILLEIACLLIERGDAAQAGMLLVFLLDQPQLPGQRRQRARNALARLGASAAAPIIPTPSLAEILSLVGD